jgi:hypothetical protein
MALIYVILESEDRYPVITSTSLEKAKELLDEYMGMGPKFPESKVEYLGFTPYDSTYVDPYEGILTYKSEGEIQKFIRYCMSIDELN